VGSKDFPREAGIQDPDRKRMAKLTAAADWLIYKVDSFLGYFYELGFRYGKKPWLR
jgi:hypothetical protein